MLKFQFKIVRTNVTNNTPKVIDRNKFGNISIPRDRCSHMFWFLPRQITIRSNVTNNTTKVIGRHKNIFILYYSSRFRHRFRNFSFYIRIFTFVLPSKIINFFFFLFIIPLKWRNINFFIFRLNGKRNRSVINNSWFGTRQFFQFNSRLD